VTPTKMRQEDAINITGGELNKDLGSKVRTSAQKEKERIRQRIKDLEKELSGNKP
jgi:hypothetical protein